MKIIAISGKAKSGKDELCNILCETYNFERIAFADKVKDISIKYYGVTEEEVTTKKTKASRMIIQGVGNTVRQNSSQVYKMITENSEEKILIGVSGFPEWVERIAMEEFHIEPIDFKRKLKYNKMVFEGVLNMFNEMHKEFYEISRNVSQDVWVNYLVQSLPDTEICIVTDVRYKNEKEAMERYGKVIKISRTDKPEIEAGATHPSEIELDDETKWDYVIVNTHKTDWKDRLVVNSANAIRKFDSEGFFSEENKTNFRIHL